MGLGLADKLKLALKEPATVSGDAVEKHYYLSPLEVAVSLGHKNACKLLLAKGANPNGRPGDIERPLTIAAKLSNGPLVENLLKAGANANANAKDGDGKLPIELTDSESIKALLRTKQ